MRISALLLFGMVLVTLHLLITLLAVVLVEKGLL